MKIAILQFAPELRQLNSNIAKADALLRDVTHGSLDLLVLPELAFSGYNFPNATAIKPYLEPTARGPTAVWARNTAKRLGCLVSVGYPEIATEPEDGSEGDFEQNARLDDSKPQVAEGSDLRTTSKPKPKPKSRTRCYNATLTVDPTGTLVAHYRKTNLYYTDATWSWPNPQGFRTVGLPLPLLRSTPLSFTKDLNNPASSSNFHPTSNCNPALTSTSNFTSNLAIGPASSPISTPVSTTVSTRNSPSIPATFAICMDFNPAHFTAPWNAYELASHIRRSNAKLLVASNAWLTHKTREELLEAPEEHDADTLGYWLSRLTPLLEEGGGWKLKGGAEEGGGETGGEKSDGENRKEDGGQGRAWKRAWQREKERERIIVIANRVGIEPGICRACDLTRGCPPEEEEEEQAETKKEAEVVEIQSSVSLKADTAEESTAMASTEPTLQAPADDLKPGSGIMALEARYAGSSCVFGLRGDRRIRMYGLLGRAEEKLLVVDTEEAPEFVASLVSRAERDAEDEEEE